MVGGLLAAVIVGGIIWLASKSYKQSLHENVLAQLEKMGKHLALEGQRIDDLLVNVPNSKLFNRVVKGNLDGQMLDIQAKFLFDTVGPGEAGGHWEFSILWHCENKQNLEMQIYKETILSTVGKRFGEEDIIIGNKEFDKRFIIQCNDKAFPKSKFNKQFCDQLLNQHKKFGSFRVIEEGVRYIEHVCPKNDDVSIRLIEIIKVAQQLAKMVDS
ncbi:MAG: hypothetical protein GY810_23725 [Aureispira sp.]|nr:hypothetical protein [Aureispira sp.]